MEDIPTVCALDHRGFATLGSIQFCRSDADGAPVLAIPFEGRQATIPLRSLQRELGIADGSPDGRMLALIADSLDFVAGLRPGDTLPAEVTSGEASWEPRAEHRARAEQRLQMQLVAWLGQDGDAPSGARVVKLGRLEGDVARRTHIQRALSEAATAIGVGNAEAVLPLIGAVAGELAYVEALRDTLLAKVKLLVAAVEGLGRGWRGDGTRLEALKQTQRLSRLALDQIGRRFADIDGQTSEIIATLKNVEAQRVFIRSNRDWLYRTRRAWDPTLAGWKMPPTKLDDPAWALIQRTYHFLAPRFMPVQEWQGFATRAGRDTLRPAAVRRW